MLTCTADLSPPSQFHMQSRAAEIANICFEKTNVEVKWLCAAAQFWAHLLTCEPLHALPDYKSLPTIMLHCKYFISFIIYQLWKIKSTQSGCNLRERKIILWCAACWQWCIRCADSKSTNGHMHWKRNGDWCVGHWHPKQNNEVVKSIQMLSRSVASFWSASRKGSLLCSVSWARLGPRKKKKILVISVICIIERNSIRKFSLLWEMTWVCWNYSQWYTNKHAGIKENA